MNNLIEFDNASLGYGRKAVLSGLSFAIRRGDFLGIVGPNGAGKTTLLKSILGVLRPIHGRVNRPAGLRFGYVPQRQSMDETYPLTAMNVALMGRYGLLGPFHRPKKHDVEVTLECLDIAGIRELAGASYRDLSGGQKQRVLIARALAAEPEALVLDEPTNDMDLAGERTVMDLVKRLRDERGITVVMVSHILSVVLNYADRIAFLDGSFSIGPVEEMVTSENLSELYGVPVEVASVGERRVVL